MIRVLEPDDQNEINLIDNDDSGRKDFIEIIQEKSNKSKTPNEKKEDLLNINSQTKGFHKNSFKIIQNHF